jgi:hypothetical protein
MRIDMKAGRFVPGILGLLGFAAWLYVSKKPGQSATYSPESLTQRWHGMSAYFATLFGIAFLALIIAFWKRLSWRTVALTSLNVATAWGFVTLYFITSDSLAHPQLAQIGLGSTEWLFLGGGVVWSIVSFYLFGRAVDASPRS